MSTRPTIHREQAPTGSAYAVPLRVLAAGSAATTVLILPALGIGARFYDVLAHTLAARGYNAVTLEQRGHGDSSLRPSRRVDFGFRAWLEEDIPAALDWIWTQLPGERRLVLGHSLGGHLGAMACGLYPERIDALVLSACGSPWRQGFSGSSRLGVELLNWVVPASTALLGHFPGHRLGFGGREARQLMHDWRHMLTHNRYRARGVTADLDAGVAAFAGPVLSLRYRDDTLAPAAASRAVTDKFRSARVDEIVLDADAVGGRADHYGWARSPAQVVEHMADWDARHGGQRHSPAMALRQTG